MPLMEGDSERIAIGPHVASPTATVPPLAFSSSDPTVFDVSPKIAAGSFAGARSTVLTGVGPGSATLILRNADTGAMFDSAPVRVATAASIVIVSQLQTPGFAAMTGGNLTLAVGDRASILPQVEDAAGELLAGWSGVVFTIADTSVAAMDPGDELAVSAVATGQTTLHAQAGAVGADITITVE
jgi:hypothetical protein